MKSILSRLQYIQEQLEREGSEKISVIFTDGTTRLLDGGECIDLIYSDPDSVARFEGRGDGSGQLSDLLNGILEEA